MQRFLSMLRPHDTRLLLYPFLLVLTFMGLHHDSDNIFFNFIKDGMVPILVVCFGTRISAEPEPGMDRELSPALA